MVQIAIYLYVYVEYDENKDKKRRGTPVSSLYTIFLQKELPLFKLKTYVSRFPVGDIFLVLTIINFSSNHHTIFT